MIYLFLSMIFVLGLIYLGMGFIPYQISKLHGDYPGPKEIYSNNVMPTSSVDYLFVHGASLDARTWNGVLKRNSDKSMVAISLAQHNEGVKYANPYNATNDLVTYLKTHQVKRAIIGHSTASLWIAGAYSIYPDAFKDIQIILLAPSFASNIHRQDLHILRFWNSISWLVPNLMLKFGVMGSCSGDQKYSYAQAKSVYSYGRLFLYNSIRYYNDLVHYSFASETISSLDYFLKEDKKNIKIYISDSDKALNPDNTKKVAQNYNLTYEVVVGMSHIMLADSDEIWLKDV